MRKSYVYKITCKITGEFYFGSSFRAKRDSYWGGGRKIKDRVALYGKENFIKEILGEFDDRVEAHKKENQYIEKFRHDEKCLNIHLDYRFGTYGEESRTKIGAANAIAMLGKHLSEETRAKIGAASAIANRGEKSPWYGKHLTEEVKAKIGAAMRGKHRTEEVKAKIGAAMRGKHLSEEHRAKLSAVHRGKLCGKHWRKNPVTGKREWYD